MGNRGSGRGRQSLKMTLREDFWSLVVKCGELAWVKGNKYDVFYGDLSVVLLVCSRYT